MQKTSYKHARGENYWRGCEGVIPDGVKFRSEEIGVNCWHQMLINGVYIASFRDTPERKFRITNIANEGLRQNVQKILDDVADHMKRKRDAEIAEIKDRHERDKVAASVSAATAWRDVFGEDVPPVPVTPAVKEKSGGSAKAIGLAMLFSLVVAAFVAEGMK